MEIVQKEAFKVVGIEVIADWEGLWVEMPKAWQRFIARHTEIENRVGDRLIDICLSREEGRYKQVICSEVAIFGEVPDGMIATEIPTQRYICHRHQGPVTEIAASFEAIYRWADDHDYPVDAFKLDIGYTAEGLEKEHDLFVRLVE